MSVYISIICPVYNKERYIKDAIDSVLNQTFSKWELLLIDDGSSDNSFAIASDYSGVDSRIKSLKRVDFNQYKGASVCRNIGIEKAEGQFIMFLDADDCLMRFALEQRYFYAQRHQQFDVFIYNTRNFYGSIPVYKHAIREFNGLLEADKEKVYLKRFCKYELPWNISAPLWKKGSLCKLQGFTESFQRLQDPELHIRALISQSKFCRIKTSIPDVAIRLDEDRRSHDYAEHLRKHNESIIEFFKLLKPKLESSGYSSWLPYFSCYILSSEQIFDWVFYKYPEYREQCLKIMKAFYEDELVQEYLTGKVKVVIFFMRKFSKIKILHRLKVYTIILRIYKMLL